METTPYYFQDLGKTQRLHCPWCLSAKLLFQIPFFET